MGYTIRICKQFVFDGSKCRSIHRGSMVLAQTEHLDVVISFLVGKGSTSMVYVGVIVVMCDICNN